VSQLASHRQVHCLGHNPHPFLCGGSACRLSQSATGKNDKSTIGKTVLNTTKLIPPTLEAVHLVHLSSRVSTKLCFFSTAHGLRYCTSASNLVQSRTVNHTHAWKHGTYDTHSHWPGARLVQTKNDCALFCTCSLWSCFLPLLALAMPYANTQTERERYKKTTGHTQSHSYCCLAKHASAGPPSQEHIDKCTAETATIYGDEDAQCAQLPCTSTLSPMPTPSVC
jgi:hypothetical protein